MATGKDLSVSQTVPMRPENREKLRIIAAHNGVRPGLLSRALILAGIEMLDDPRITAVLDEEISAERERQSAAGQAAMKARWHSGGTTRDQGSTS